MENKNLPRVNFSDAAMKLSALCDQIDDTEEHIDALLMKEFEDALIYVKSSIDRRKALYRELESKIDMAKNYRDEITQHIKRYERIKERLIEVTKQVLFANPNIPFKDSMGKALKVIQNPIPKLVYGVSLDDADPIYLKEITSREIDTEKVKKDLSEGKEIAWARLEYGTQIRGFK